MKNNIVLLSGKISSGKTTVAKYLEDNFNYTELAFATKLKLTVHKFLEETYHLNIPIDYFYKQEYKNYVIPVKFPNNLPSTIRGSMQWWGELMKEQFGELFWVNQLIYDLKIIPNNIVISDARYEFEINAIKNDRLLQHTYNIISIKLLSDRSPKDKHISETHLDSYNQFDFIVDNNSTINKLYSKINKIILSL